MVIGTILSLLITDVPTIMAGLIFFYILYRIFVYFIPDETIDASLEDADIDVVEDENFEEF